MLPIPLDRIAMLKVRDLWAMNPTRCQLRYGGLVGVDW